MRKTLLCLLILFMLLLTGCNKKITYVQPSGNISDMSNYNIEDGQFVDVTISEILAILDSKITTIVYMGYDNCNWCQDLVPVLNDISKEKDMKVYYMDLYRDINYQNQEGVFAIGEKCVEAGLLEADEAEKGFYFPTILYIRNGKVVAIHTGTVSGHNANDGDLSEKQIARLQYQLRKEFDGLLNG